VLISFFLLFNPSGPPFGIFPPLPRFFLSFSLPPPLPTLRSFPRFSVQLWDGPLPKVAPETPFSSTFQLAENVVFPYAVEHFFPETCLTRHRDLRQIFLNDSPRSPLWKGVSGSFLPLFGVTLVNSLPKPLTHQGSAPLLPLFVQTFQKRFAIFSDVR